MSQFKALTLSNSAGLLNVLKTPCGVCEAFDPIDKTKKHPVVNEFTGLWDTGASGTVISQNVVQQLNLKPISKAKVYHANGSSVVNVFAINLFLPNQVAFPFVKVTEGVLNGTDLLIGMDVITQGDFSISNLGGKTTFSFRVPSLKTVDFVEESKQKEPPAVSDKVGRNQQCPCGSGKKHKHCCGKK